jgi:hypothetical protein
MMAREAEWKACEVQRDKEIGWGSDHCPSSPLDGWPGNDEHRKEWVASDSRVVTCYLPINWGWPSIEGESRCRWRYVLTPLNLRRSVSPVCHL